MPQHPYQNPHSANDTVQNGDAQSPETDESGNIIETSEEKEPIVPMGSIIVFIVVVIGLIGLFIFFKLSGKKKTRVQNDFDDDDFDDDDMPE